MVSLCTNIYSCLLFLSSPTSVCSQSMGERIGLSLLTLSSIWDLASTEREVEYKDP